MAMMDTVLTKELSANLSCWEEAATCGNCQLVLPVNETMIFSVADSSIMAGVAILFSILGFVINSIAIMSVMMNTRLRQRMTTPYILSVFFADLIFCSFLLPILAIRNYTRQSEANIWQGLCSVFPVGFYLCIGAFILSLMCVTIIQTCILFCKKRTEQIFTIKMRSLTILLCWLLPLSLLIPSMSGSYGTIEMVEYIQSCTIVPGQHGRHPFQLFYKLFLFTPYTVMILCNMAICVKIKISYKRISVNTRRAENRFILCLFLVFLFFLLATLPTWAVNKYDECFKNTTTRAIAFMLGWSGFIVNPIIFFVILQSYRDGGRRLYRQISVAVQSENTVKKVQDYHQTSNL